MYLSPVDFEVMGSDPVNGQMELVVSWEVRTLVKLKKGEPEAELEFFPKINGG